MNWSSATAGGDFRASRICCFFSISVYSRLMLLVLVFAFAIAPSSCRPPEEEYQAYDNFEGSDEYANVDNVEWHHIKVVDGVTEKSHPIIMYKEDFVTENFDPLKNGTGNSVEMGGGKQRHPGRKYKNAGHRHRNRINRAHNKDYNSNSNNNDDHRDIIAAAEKYHVVKPQNILFDILPQQPILSTDETVLDDPHIEAISLADAETDEQSNKDDLRKHPKKYNHRSRRSLRENYVGNPYYQHRRPQDISFILDHLYESINAEQQRESQAAVKQAVPGKLWNSLNLPVEIPVPRPPTDEPSVPIDFAPRFNPDRVVWGGGFSSNSRTTRRPVIQQRPVTTRRPEATRRTLPPLFHDSNPNEVDFSFATRRPPAPAPAPTTSRPIVPPQIQTERPGGGGSSSGKSPEVSQCVWAIVNCCSSRDSDIRYRCFEQLGCMGAFWDLNPCADNIRDDAIQFVNNYYE